MVIAINATFKDVVTCDILRVIGIDYSAEEVHLFKCFERVENCSVPYSISLEKLNTMIHEKNIEFVDDPFAKNVKESQLSKKEILIRDRAYKIVMELVEIEDIFSPIIRNKLIKKICSKYKVSKPTVYKNLKKYWRGGLNINALLPNFENCGAPNLERNSGVSQELRKIIRKGFHEFVIKKKYSIRTAYNETIRKYTKTGTKFKKFKYHTFYLHGRHAFSEEKLRKSKSSENRFNSNERLLHGRSNDIVNGPCKQYQIDSTMRDIRIVSTINRNQYIGRPTFYVVMDVWTRVIVGVLITLDNPSYIAAAHTLFVSFRSKRILVEELNLGPEHLGWSNSFLCEELLADRAEFLGPKSDQIVKNLGIRLGNTVAYRPDLKGNVEKIIDLIQERVKHLFLENGQVLKDDGERGSIDTRREACVTLEDLNRITWIVVNEYNNYHWIDGYPLTNEMIRDGVKKIPAELHKWGIQQNLGVERIIDEMSLWFNLMESKYITPNKRGLRLNKQDYVPVEEHSFKILQSLILAHKTKKVEVKYDPRVYKNIYWVHNGNFHKLRLRGKDDAQFFNEWEIVTTNASYNTIKDEAQEAELEISNINNSEMELLINSNTDIKPVITNSRPAKSLEREFNRATINNIPEKRTTKMSKKSSNVKKSQADLLTKLKQFND